jgi:hypothetical protein
VQLLPLLVPARGAVRRVRTLRERDERGREKRSRRVNFYDSNLVFQPCKTSPARACGCIGHVRATASGLAGNNAPIARLRRRVFLREARGIKEVVVHHLEVLRK